MEAGDLQVRSLGQMVASGKRGVGLGHGVNKTQILTLRPVSGTNERDGREEASGGVHGRCCLRWDVNQAGRERGPLGMRVLGDREGKLSRRGQDCALECVALAKRRKDAVDSALSATEATAKTIWDLSPWTWHNA